jgi:hypothetical protein
VRARAKPRTRGRLSTCHCTLVLTVTVCISVCDSGSADRLGLTAMAVGSVLGRCARLWRASTNCGVSVRGVAAVGTIGVSSGEARDGGCPGRQGLEPGLGDGLRLVEVHGWHALESDGSLMERTQQKQLRYQQSDLLQRLMLSHGTKQTVKEPSL